ncbi:hypothetical protein [Nocardia concava]|uniref:hypothetical protein n=1 Tax=Nocardia concava TaxID=257281 RepID=UPI0002FA821C|nr:hypothetical protein [Nocardia concava]
MSSGHRFERGLDTQISLRFWLERNGFDPLDTAADPIDEDDRALGLAVDYLGGRWAA